jgi:hypothetical protein
MGKKHFNTEQDAIALPGLTHEKEDKMTGKK